MSDNHDPAFLRLQAEVKMEDLRALCRKEGRSITAALRVAGHLVDEEDVECKPPRPCTPAVALAITIRRLQFRADEPDWPESARKWRLENEAKLAKLFPTLKNR